MTEEEESEGTVPYHFIETVILCHLEDIAQSGPGKKEENEKFESRIDARIALSLVPVLREDAESSHSSEEPCGFQSLPSFPEDGEREEQEDKEFADTLESFSRHLSIMAWRGILFHILILPVGLQIRNDSTQSIMRENCPGINELCNFLDRKSVV